MTIMNSIMDQSKEMSSAAQGEQDDTMYYNLTQSETDSISISQHSLNVPNDEYAPQFERLSESKTTI